MHPDQDLLIFEVGRRVAAFWLVAPALVLFAWLLVPVMRWRRSILSGYDDRKSTMFWWAPGWGYLGFVGLGIGLMASPILDPRMAAAWQPALWPGFALWLPWSTYAVLVALGSIVVVKGVLLYLHAWVADRSERYRAWRRRISGRRRA